MLKKPRVWVATIGVGLVVATLLWVLSGSSYLVLRDGATGEEFARYPLQEGESFSVQFVHSVNKSPVVDVYRVEDGSIYVEETIYYHFGAGVQTELNAGETLTYGEDGSMVIGNIHKQIPDLRYFVGTVSDHVLTVHGEEISLRDLCGRNSNVAFSYEFHRF